MDNRVALRYAQALMDLGQDSNVLDKVAQDMQTIETTLAGSRELRAMLGSPVVKPLQKLAVMREIFGKRLETKEVSLFVDLLIRKGRAGVLREVAEQFRMLLDRSKNVIGATITSARDLDRSDKDTIQAKLETMMGKRVRPTFLIDPTLKGGFIARVGDVQIDASLAHQLQLLREQFRQGGSSILN